MQTLFLNRVVEHSINSIKFQLKLIKLEFGTDRCSRADLSWCWPTPRIGRRTIIDCVPSQPVELSCFQLLSVLFQRQDLIVQIIINICKNQINLCILS